MNIATYTKEQSAVTDFQIDWTAWLEGRTLTSSSWAISPTAGIIIVATSNTSSVATIRLSSGTWGQIYLATNHIVASDGEEEERSITIRIQQEQKYCTPTEVRRRMFGGPGPSGTGTTTALSEAELDALIEQGSRYLDLLCGVPAGYFNPPAFPHATEQTFYGDGTNYLRLPPYIPGTLNTAITVPEGYTVPTFTEMDGYLVLNSNGTLPPFTRFDRWWCGWWSGVGITISAQWGFRDVDGAIKLAVIELVINLKRETDPAELKLTNLEGQPLREKIPPRVWEIARRYRFKTGGAFA